jgi:hypothetical protein
MSNASIAPMHKNSSTISYSLASIPLSSIRQMLPDKAILGAYDFVGRLRETGDTPFHFLTSIRLTDQTLPAAPTRSV